jgi:hypothetical protein
MHPHAEKINSEAKWHTAMDGGPLAVDHGNHGMAVHHGNGGHCPPMVLHPLVHHGNGHGLGCRRHAIRSQWRSIAGYTLGLSHSALRSVAAIRSQWRSIAGYTLGLSHSALRSVAAIRSQWRSIAACQTECRARRQRADSTGPELLILSAMEAILTRANASDRVLFIGDVTSCKRGSSRRQMGILVV